MSEIPGGSGNSLAQYQRQTKQQYTLPIF
jgi:hypothetical protein